MMRLIAVAFFVLAFPAAVFAQQTAVYGTFDISTSAHLGYKNPDVAFGVSGVYKYDERYTLTADFRQLLRSEKQIGSNRARRLEIDARFYPIRLAFAGVGLESTWQTIDGVYRSAYRPRLFAGYNRKEQSIFSVGYSFPDNTERRTSSVDFRLDGFGRVLKINQRSRIDARWVRFRGLGNNVENGFRITFSVGFGKVWWENKGIYGRND